jgi:hypothetical protein
MPAIVWESLFSGAYQHMYHLKGTAVKDVKIIMLEILKKKISGIWDFCGDEYRSYNCLGCDATVW